MLLFKLSTPITVEVMQLAISECTGNPSTVNAVVETMHFGRQLSLAV